MGTISNLAIILSSVFLNCSAQLLMRKGMLQVGEVSMSLGSLTLSLGTMVANVYLWLSMCCYAVSIILWMVVLSRVEVSFAYPFSSLGYVVITLGGYFLFGESLNITRIIGLVVICAGLFIIAKS